jgi:DNA-binding MarR family transcriptional regulator/GNAT superfamily N-acetyltransferase
MPTDPITQIRAFNRFYTRRIGVLHEGLLQSPLTLAESRLLWEFAHHESLTASALGRLLGLDGGYLSRMLKRFRQQGWLEGTRSATDARQLHLRLTPAGREAFAPLDARSQQEAGALLAALPAADQQRLLHAMGTIERLLSAPEGAAPSPFTLRPHRPGDMGWVVSRHGEFYSREYGWDIGFEAMVARIAADFIERFDPSREACWIAERDGAPVGSVFLVQARDESSQAPLPGVAQLRMLLIEPAARGLGLGGRLVDECERFARQAGYRRITLWTNSLLLAARGIYAKAGYRCTGSEPHHSFGHDLVGETWEKDLLPP